MTSLWSHESGPEGAPLVVLVHGSMDRSASMVKLSRALDGDFRVLRYDRRGYGRSKPHPGPFGMGEQVADLAGVLDGRVAVVFGHSYGGNVALAAAQRYPGLVSAVAVYEPPLSWLEWWPGTSRRIRRRDDVPPELAGERFMRRMVGDTTWEGLPAKVQAERRAEGAALVGEIGDLVANPPWSAERLDLPVIAMHGSEARGHHRDGTVYLAELLSDRPAVVVDDAQHNGPYTHPLAVAGVIRTLVSLVGAGTADALDGRGRTAGTSPN